MSESFSGVMLESGFQADDPKRFRAAKVTYLGKRITVTIDRERSIRSIQQNRRHFVQCNAVAELWSVGRPVPIHPTQAHYILAKAFLGMVMTPLGEAPVKTSTLTTEQFNKFMDDIDHHFAAEGTPLPTMEAC